MKLKKSFSYALRHSLPIFAGSLQFLMISFFTGSVSYVTVAVMALLINSRHIFYGISLIEKFRNFGLWKYYLIYSLTDENYSLHCSAKIDEGMNEKWTYIFTATLTLLYWTVSCVLGSLIGTLITIDMTGVDFALTALFVTILLDQLKDAVSRLPAVVAMFSSIICLLIFGPDNFILPSLIITVAALTVLRHTIATEKEAA